MSSVGFTPPVKGRELEKLREAWRSLNDVLRNLRNAEGALINRDQNLIAAYKSYKSKGIKKVLTDLWKRHLLLHSSKHQ